MGILVCLRTSSCWDIVQTRHTQTQFLMWSLSVSVGFCVRAQGNPQHKLPTLTKPQHSDGQLSINLKLQQASSSISQRSRESTVNITEVQSQQRSSWHRSGATACSVAILNARLLHSYDRNFTQKPQLVQACVHTREHTLPCCTTVHNPAAAVTTSDARVQTRSGYWGKKHPPQLNQ